MFASEGQNSCSPFGKTFFIFLTFTIIGFGQLILAYASANGFSSIIPLEKGNVWNYSYNIHQEDYTFKTADTSMGLLSMSVDSVATLSGLNDTMFFRLAIIDSGTTYDTSQSHYRQNYSKHFCVYHDTLFSLDTFASPGFSYGLLFYCKMSDTSAMIIGIDIGSISRRTDSTAIMVGTQQYEAFSRLSGQSLQHNSPGSSYSNETSSTFQWINRIGTAYSSENRAYKVWGLVRTASSRTYTLESFNGTSIPPIPISSIKNDLFRQKAAKSMMSLNKILYIKKSVPKNIYVPAANYFNLRGQKMGRFMGGQLVVEKRVIQPKKTTPVP